MISGTPPSVLLCSRRLVLRRTLTCPTSGSGAFHAPPTAITSGLTGGHELHSAQRYRATSSLSLPANCASSRTVLGVSLASRVVRPRGSIPKSGTCRACGVCGRKLVRVLSQCTCARGSFSLTLASLPTRPLWQGKTGGDRESSPDCATKGAEKGELPPEACAHSPQQKSSPPGGTEAKDSRSSEVFAGVPIEPGAKARCGPYLQALDAQGATRRRPSKIENASRGSP